MPNGHDPVLAERGEPVLPIRRLAEEDRAKTCRHVREPPRFLAVGVLQADVRNLPAILLQKTARCW